MVGHPSDGETGRLLTREIKSGRDREYLYAHLLTPREDASSWGRLRNYTLPDSQMERTFCLGNGEDNKASLGRSPPGSLPPSRRAKGVPPGARGPVRARRPPLCCDSCHWLLAGHLPGLRGDEQKHTLQPQGSLHGKAPALSCGGKWMAGGRGCWRMGLEGKRLLRSSEPGE